MWMGFRVACVGLHEETSGRNGQKVETQPTGRRTRFETALNEGVELGGGVKLEFVPIRAGTFIMGDAENGPAHEVNITRPFWMGKYKVTQEQWQVLMGNNPSHFKGSKNPVDSVSWEDCQGFLKKLNEKYSHHGLTFSLPTEAQWEYACRAGTATRHYFGDALSNMGDYGWLADNSGKMTHPVGEKKPNAWGLYDMYGNVFEWCADWYNHDYYLTSPASDPTGPAVGTTKEIRGGYWESSEGTSAGRHSSAPPDIRISFNGFRVACVATAKEEVRRQPIR